MPGALKIALMIAVFGLLCSVSPSCSDDSGAPDKVAESKVTAQGLRMTVKLQKTQVEAGEPVVLLITIKNVSEKPLGFYWSRADHDYLLDVTDAKKQHPRRTSYGEDLEKWRPLAGGSYQECKLDSGQEFESSLNANRFFDMTMAGKYSIVVRRYVPWTAPGLGGEVVSNAVTVTVVEPSSQDRVKTTEQKEDK